MNLSILLATSTIPAELTENLTQEFQKLHEQYYLGKWQASQLNGGRFGEAVLRIIQFKDTNNYTPIGTTVPRLTVVNHVVHNITLSDSLRLYIPPLVELIMDFRNNRNVAHLGTISVNCMDSSLVINASNWIMAEIIRLEGNVTSEVAEEAIKKIIERKIPIVEEIDGRLKTLNPSLTVKNKILVCLYQKYPQIVSDSELLEWLKDKNPTRFKKYISDLDKASLIDYTNGRATLTKLGIPWVEKNISFKLEV